MVSYGGPPGWGLPVGSEFEYERIGLSVTAFSGTPLSTRSGEAPMPLGMGKVVRFAAALLCLAVAGHVWVYETAAGTQSTSTKKTAISGWQTYVLAASESDTLRRHPNLQTASALTYPNLLGLHVPNSRWYRAGVWAPIGGQNAGAILQLEFLHGRLALIGIYWDQLESWLDWAWPHLVEEVATAYDRSLLTASDASALDVARRIRAYNLLVTLELRDRAGNRLKLTSLAFVDPLPGVPLKRAIAVTYVASFAAPLLDVKPTPAPKGSY